MKEGWEYKKLGEVALFINGDRGKNYPSQKDFVEKGIPFINAGHIKGNNVDFGSMNYISKEKFLKLGSGKIQNGDILFCLRGSLGKKAIVNNISEGAIASSLVIIRVTNIINAFLSYFLDSPTIKREIYKSNNGSSQPNLSAKSVSDFVIPLPSEAEQQHIVEELDLLSSIIEKKKAQLNELDNLAQSLFYEMFVGFSVDTAVSTYILSLSGGKSLAGNEECVNKVLKTGAVTFDYFNGEEVKNLPIDYIPRQEHLLQDGDILISRMNTLEYVGACAYVWKAPANTYLPDRLWRAKLKDNVNPIYLWFSLIQDNAKEQIRSLASGTSGSMKNISIPRFLSIKIKDVPLTLQNQFASKIEAIEHQKELIKQSIKEVETLFNSRMDFYFN